MDRVERLVRWITVLRSAKRLEDSLEALLAKAQRDIRALKAASEFGYLAPKAVPLLRRWVGMIADLGDARVGAKDASTDLLRALDDPGVDQNAVASFERRRISATDAL